MARIKLRQDEIRSLFLLLMLILGILIGINAHACDSYKSCMDCVNQGVDDDSVNCSSGSNIDIYKAIAYKLDEISKKLAKQEFRMEKITVPNQPEPKDRVAKDIKFSNGDVLNLMTQIVDGSEIVEKDGTTAFKGKKYEISRAMGCIYKIEIIDPRDPDWRNK